MTEQPSDHQRSRALADVARDYPPWHPWRGVFGMLYARWPQSSPPLVVRAASVPALREAIESAEADRGVQR